MSGAGDDTLARPLVIVAGAGPLPYEAARAAAARRKVVVVAIDEEADPAPPDIPVARFGYGEIGRAMRFVRERDGRDVLFLGAIRRRPDYRRILGDPATLRLVPKVLRAVVGGDDTAARNVLKLVEELGFSIVSAPEAVPELLAPHGTLTARQPDAEHQADIAIGAACLDALGAYDVGQAAAVVGQRVIAVEGAEGTDAMIARCGELLTSRRVRAKPGRMVLVKRAKNTQDVRADLPVVGAATLRHALSAGFGGIAVEAGRTIYAERETLRREADAAGAFVVAT